MLMVQQKMVKERVAWTARQPARTSREPRGPWIWIEKTALNFTCSPTFWFFTLIWPNTFNALFTQKIDGLIAKLCFFQVCYMIVCTSSTSRNKTCQAAPTISEPSSEPEETVVGVLYVAVWIRVLKEGSKPFQQNNITAKSAKSFIPFTLKWVRISHKSWWDKMPMKICKWSWNR